MTSRDDTGNGSQPIQLQVKYEPTYNDYGEEIFSAGQVVQAGTYLEVDGGRQINLDRPGPLPASLNGRRAYYSRLERPWMNATVNRSITNSPN